MRHRAKVQHFGRAQGPRKALLRGLVSSLVAEGRIKTTLAKAKELRRHVERAVTVGKRGGLGARRILLSRYPSPVTVETIMKDLAARFQDRNGGYTRILKLGERPGDRAEMAFIEFVDYAPKAKGSDPGAAPKAKGRKKKAAAADASPSNKDKVKTRRLQVREQLAKRKRVRKIQGASRQEARS
jgi:large subunit ribosomal protein L17